MSAHQSRNHSRRHNAVQAVKATIGFMVIVALTYIAVVAAQHSPPSPDESAVFASEIPMMNSKLSAETPDVHAAAQPARLATPGTSAQKAPSREFDYFPDHYVNQATKIEEQPPTF